MEFVVVIKGRFGIFYTSMRLDKETNTCMMNHDGVRAIQRQLKIPTSS